MNYTFGVNDVNVQMKSATSDVWDHMTKDYCAPSNKISAETVPLPPPSERAQTIFNEMREAGSLRMNDPACAYDTLGAVSTDWSTSVAVNHTARPVPLQNPAESMPADHDDGSGQERQQSRGRSVLTDWSTPMAANPARTSAIPQERASSFTGKSEADKTVDPCEYC